MMANRRYRVVTVAVDVWVVFLVDALPLAFPVMVWIVRDIAPDTNDGGRWDVVEGLYACGSEGLQPCEEDQNFAGYVMAKTKDAALSAFAEDSAGA